MRTAITLIVVGIMVQAVALALIVQFAVHAFH